MNTHQTQPNCEQLLDSFAAGSLDPELATRVEAWLANQPELADPAGLRATPPFEAMPHKQALKHGAAVAPLWRWAAAACLASLLAAGALWLWRPRPQGTPAPAPQPLVAINQPAAEPQPQARPAASRPQRPLVNSVVPLPPLGPAPAVPAPAAPRCPAGSKALPTIVEVNNMVAYLPDTVEVDCLVDYLPLLEGQPEWLEPISTPIYNRITEERNRLEETVLALAERTTAPITQLFKKQQ